MNRPLVVNGMLSQFNGHLLVASPSLEGVVVATSMFNRTAGNAITNPPEASRIFLT